MLYTSLAEADRLGILKIQHPMRNKRVKLPKLPKREPAVVDKGKLKLLFDRAQTTRLYPFIVLATATGCRRGELLALQWPDPGHDHGRTERIQVAGADQSGPAGQEHQVGEAAAFRGAGFGAARAGRSPRRTG